MPTVTPRVFAAVLALSAAVRCTPAAAQASAGISTIYLKEGGVIRGQILDDTDPSGVRIKSLKSGTTFLLKSAWIDSIVKPTTPPPATPQVQAAPVSVAAATPVAKSVSAPAAVSEPVAPPAPKVTAPAHSDPLPPKPAVAAPMVDGLEPPPSTHATPPAPAPAASKKSEPTSASRSTKFPHWYVGGGGSAATGTDGSTADIGYTGMLAYSAGLGSMTQMRFGGNGSYWSDNVLDGNFYDLTGTLDLLVGRKNPSFIAPYGLIGGLGGTRSVSPPPGFTGYSRSPLYGARLGGGINSRRIFVEVSYQRVWVNGVASGYVPFLFGFRF
jgi:hypothetical protein